MRKVVVFLLVVVGIIGFMFFKKESLTKKTQDPISDCNSNPNPRFTHNFTDVSAIDSLIPPIYSSGTGVKHTVLVNTIGRVPLYMPATGDLFQGSYYDSEGMGHYLLDFQITCEVVVSFDHVAEPVEKIRALLPSKPKNDSRTDFFEPKVKFRAGELIGYTSGTKNAKNWNFGVYNNTVQNYLSGDSEVKQFPKYTTAICPFEYYSKEMKNPYYALLSDSFGDIRPDKNLCLRK